MYGREGDGEDRRSGAACCGNTYGPPHEFYGMPPETLATRDEEYAVILTRTKHGESFTKKESCHAVAGVAEISELVQETLIRMDGFPVDA